MAPIKSKWEKRSIKGEEKNTAHMSACTPTAFASPKVGMLCEDLVPSGGVHVHLLLRLNIMEVLFN